MHKGLKNILLYDIHLKGDSKYFCLGGEPINRKRRNPNLKEFELQLDILGVPFNIKDSHLTGLMPNFHISNILSDDKLEEMLEWACATHIIIESRKSVNPMNLGISMGTQTTFGTNISNKGSMVADLYTEFKIIPAHFYRILSMIEKK